MSRISYQMRPFSMVQLSKNFPNKSKKMSSSLSILRNLSGKVALITGASSGIGAATSVLFSQLGAQLCLTGRNEDNLKDTVSKCDTSQSQPLICIADLNSEADTERLMKQTIEHYGRLNILVNCAGILELGSIENTSLAQYDRVFNSNVRAMFIQRPGFLAWSMDDLLFTKTTSPKLLSVYHVTMLAVPHLIETKGNIVNVSSVNGLRSFAGVLAYNMSKSAMDQFTKCIALELAPKQVRVNSVNPGVIITNLQKRGGLDDEAYAQFLERTKGTHALGRAGQPEEVAHSIAFLASDDASFITGVQLPCDGGRHAMCPR